MDTENKNINILYIGESIIEYEGLQQILKSTNPYSTTEHSQTVEEAVDYLTAHPQTIIVVSSACLNKVSEKVTEVIPKYRDSIWILLINSAFDIDMLSFFVRTIDINSSFEDISHKISKDKEEEINSEGGGNELSEREIEVLKTIALGRSNKEIAEQLCISIHTVMTHRKNIIHKIGIKSQAGLTIYALSKKLIDLESVE